MERRAGADAPHDRATLSSLDEVVDALQRYARGDGSWTRRLAWNPVEHSALER